MDEQDSGSQAQILLDRETYEQMRRLGLGVMIEVGDESVVIMVKARSGSPDVSARLIHPWSEGWWHQNLKHINALAKRLAEVEADLTKVTEQRNDQIRFKCAWCARAEAAEAEVARLRAEQGALERLKCEWVNDALEGAAQIADLHYAKCDMGNPGHLIRAMKGFIP